MKRFQQLVCVILSVFTLLSTGVLPVENATAASQADSLIAVALGENGNSNGLKYGRNNWCAHFISWCARQANIPENIVPTLADADGYWYARNATLHYFFEPWKQSQCDEGISQGIYCSSRSQYEPQIGDMIFFRWAGDYPHYTFSHIGLVYGMDSTKVYTIEGNSGSPGAVRYREYSRDDERIVAYGTPNYNGISINYSVPAAPAGLTAIKASSGSARISWNAGQDARSYQVEYFSPKANGWVKDVDYKYGTSYISTGLINYSSYTFRIRAVNPAGASPWVEIKYVTNIADAPNTPATPQGELLKLFDMTFGEISQSYSLITPDPGGSYGGIIYYRFVDIADTEIQYGDMPTSSSKIIGLRTPVANIFPQYANKSIYDIIGMDNGKLTLQGLHGAGELGGREVSASFVENGLSYNINGGWQGEREVKAEVRPGDTLWYHNPYVESVLYMGEFSKSSDAIDFFKRLFQDAVSKPIIEENLGQITFLVRMYERDGKYVVTCAPEGKTLLTALAELGYTPVRVGAP